MDAVTWGNIVDQGSTFILAIVLIYSVKIVVEWYRADMSRMLDIMLKYTEQQEKFNTLLRSIEEELEERDSIR